MESDMGELFMLCLPYLKRKVMMSTNYTHHKMSCYFNIYCLYYEIPSRSKN